jgi:cysteine protease ATG4
MHRSAQMVLSRGLLIAGLGHHFHLASLNYDQEIIYRSILSLFEDTESALFSIQKICRMGFREFGQRIGSWYGPSIAAQVISLILKEYQDKEDEKSTVKNAVHQLLSNVVVHTAKDCHVIVDHIVLLAQNKRKNACGNDCDGRFPHHSKLVSEETNNSEERLNWTPLILFIPVKLGGEQFSVSYTKNLLDLFTWKSFLGIAGVCNCFATICILKQCEYRIWNVIILHCVT